MLYKAIRNTVKRCTADTGGFTLIEMVVAIAISSVILLIVYSAHRSIMTSIYDLTGVAEFYEDVNCAVGRIDRDISYAYFKRYNDNVCFIGQNESGQISNGRIDFVSTEYTDRMLAVNPKKSKPQSDVREVGYYLVRDNEIQGVYHLMRREDVAYDDDPLAGGISSMLLRNVADIRFEFWLRNDWVNKWDSRNDKKFPQAVRTTLKVKNYRGTVEEFIVVSYINPVN